MWIASALVSDPFVMADQSDERRVNVAMLVMFVRDIENSIRWLDDGQIERRCSLDTLVMNFS